MEQALQHAFSSKHLWDLILPNPFMQPNTKEQCLYIISMLDHFVKLWLPSSGGEGEQARPTFTSHQTPLSFLPPLCTMLWPSQYAQYQKLDCWVVEARDVQGADVQALGLEILAFFKGTEPDRPARQLPFAVLLEDEGREIDEKYKRQSQKLFYFLHLGLADALPRTHCPPSTSSFKRSLIISPPHQALGCFPHRLR